MELSFAISVYDKLHELALLVDVIRQHFAGRAYVHVICNDTTRRAADFAHIDLDELRIEARLQLQAAKYGGLDGVSRQVLQLRILDQVLGGLAACAGACRSDYTMHLHADAWPLRKDGLEAILSGLAANRRAVALRGYGFAYTPIPGQSGGSAQDMFLVADNRVARETGLFECDLLDLLPTRPNIHGLVAQLLKFRLGARRVWWYSDLTDTVGWAGTPHRLSPHSAMCPLSLDPERGLLHLERTRFLDDDGYRFMSKYLWEFGATSGRHVQAHLREFPYRPDLAERHEAKLRQLFSGHAGNDHAGDGHTGDEYAGDGHAGDDHAGDDHTRDDHAGDDHTGDDIDTRMLRDLMPVELRAMAERGERPGPAAMPPHPEYMTGYRDNLELLDAVADQLGLGEDELLALGVLRYETGAGMLQPRAPSPAVQESDTVLPVATPRRSLVMGPDLPAQEP